MARPLPPEKKPRFPYVQEVVHLLAAFQCLDIHEAPVNGAHRDVVEDARVDARAVLLLQRLGRVGQVPTQALYGSRNGLDAHVTARYTGIKLEVNMRDVVLHDATLGV